MLAAAGSRIDAEWVRDTSALRVLDITKFYSAQSGGVKTYLDAKIADFAQRTIVHTLVVPGATNAERRVQNTRVCTIRGPVIPFSPSYRLITSGSEVARQVSSAKPHIIEVGSPFLVPYLVRRALGSRPSAAVIGFYHSDLIRTYAEPYAPYSALAPVRVLARNLARHFIRRVYSRFDATIAASASVVAELRGLGIPNVHCVPLGVDLTLFRPESGVSTDLRARLRIDPGRRIALFVGRLTREKRLDVVLHALHALDPSDRPHLVLVGEGQQRGRWETIARENGFVSVLPYVSNKVELARLYRSADFYVAPGPGETFGLAIAEAMASGLPVVAVERGAAPDRVAGSDCGLLYAHGSADSCARALRQMTHATSPLLRARARRHAEQCFSWKRTFAQLVQVYRLVLDAKAPWPARA
jgi:alpha-1,6-mannosyltransferase